MKTIEELEKENITLRQQLQTMQTQQAFLAERFAAIAGRVEHAEKHKLETAVGVGDMRGSPSANDLREFADAKIKVTSFEEIAKYDAQSKGYEDFDSYVRDAAEKMREIKNARD